MRELLWKLVAKVVSRPNIRDWLIDQSLKTPYTEILGPEGDVYMGRWWLFNPYPSASDGGRRKWGDRLPSVRIHHIRRPDIDRHLHDHPWDARTIILQGSYVEELPGLTTPSIETRQRVRNKGDTGTLLFGEYHRIDKISEGGVWTLFITWKYRGTWGFNVDGKKVPWRTYLKTAGHE